MLLAIDRNADPGVDHLDEHVPRGLSSAGPHGDRARGRELEAVAHQVDEHLLDLAEVAAHGQAARRGRLEHELEPLLLRLDVGDGVDLVEQRPQVDRLDLQRQSPRLDLRDVEHVVDEAEQVLRALQRLLLELAFLFG